jgi:PAS domain S-box-containing protein
MPSRLSITSKAAGAAGLMFVMLICIAGLTYLKSEQLISAMRWVSHTSEVRSRLEHMNSAMRTLEAVQRGYIITGDERFLTEYPQWVRRINSLVDEVDEMTKDNEAQQQRISELRPVLAQKLQFSQASIDLRKKSGEQSASQLISGLEGQRYGERMTRLISAMEDEEYSLLKQRERELGVARDATILTLAILVVLAFVMFFLIIWLVRNYSREQELAQSVLKDRESRLTAILSSMGEGVYQLDTDGRLVYLNSAAEEMLGYKLENVKGQNMHELIHSREPEGAVKAGEDCPLLKVLKSGELVEIDSDAFLRADATFLPVRCSGAPMLVDGKVIGAVVSFQDITHTKAAQKRVSEFYSTVSHELRTPLTSIRAALGLLEGGVVGSLSDKALQLVHIARTESDRLIRLINDILDIRKIEAGKLELTRELIPVEELVKSVVEANRSAANQAGVELVAKIECSGDVTADHDRIIQVLTNLVSNAVKFSPKNSEVIIRAERKRSNFRFSVTDVGSGIHPDEIHKLFGWFQQLDSSDTRPKGGTGLGLAISKGIIEQHGGTIGVDSEYGQGSTFWIELPARDTASLQLDRKAATTKPARVLLIEDDARLCDLVSATVAQYGYEMLAAGSIEEAEKFLQAENVPDVILLDISLPDGDGLELMQKIRKEPLTKNIPIVILTGKQPELDVYAEPLLIDWITKPFDEERLLKALRLAIRGLRPAKVLIVEDDDSTRQVLVQQLAQLGVSPIEAPDGAAAIQMVRNENPDLIILDIGIPAPDGFDVVKILRQEKSQKTPLLVYTSRDLTSEDIRELSLGLSKHLVKSRTTEEQFLASVRDLLNGLISTESSSSGK